MSKHEKMTRPTAATVEWVEMGAGLDRATTSTKHDITTDRSRQIQISDYLGFGQAAAVPLRHLKELAHLPGRDVRRMIQAERLRGTPILSDNSSGYFLAASDQERDRFVLSMRGRAAEIEAVADAVERAVID